MTTIHINDLLSLRERFAVQGTDSLFRGQINHYEDKDGATSITTSFERRGCVPPKMLKWRHYAKELFRVLSEAGSDTTIPTHYHEAILQHYGWRSFYIDVTKSPAVAAWFASHAYTRSTPVVEMTEGANEEFVMLVHNTPKYVPSENSGTIYVISKAKAQSGKAIFVDLTEIQCDDTKPRFYAQQGGLIGPFSRLPPSAVLERWIVPPALLREFAAEEGIKVTDDLFPAREADIFLNLLLAVPWEYAGGKSGGRIFARGLDIPEYDYRPTRRYSSNTAFSCRAWLSRTKHFGSSSLLGTAVRFGVKEESFYYHVDTPPLRFERLVKLLNEHPVIVIEMDGIVRGPEGHLGDEYTKGIILHRIDDQLVHISELVIRHPGTQVLSARALSPWTYKIAENGAFLRHPHEYDCPCNNPGRHQQLFRYAQVIELLLGEDSFRAVSALEYRHKDIGTQRASLGVNSKQAISKTPAGPRHAGDSGLE